MPQNKIVKYNKLDQFLSLATSHEQPLPNLIFIHGQQYLLKQAQDLICSSLLGESSDKFALDTLEGGSVTMGEIIEQVSTFSIFLSKKIVLVKNIPLFLNKKNAKSGEILFSQSEIDHFTDFLEKGIPENHFLVLTTNNADKRKKVFKVIKKNALIIDCQIAQGLRKIDIDEQNAVSQSIARKILSAVNKNIEPGAFTSLLNLTGFNLELFARNLEKLIVYSGKNPTITVADVNKVIARDKTDPIFDLTNALMEKNTTKTLFYFNALLNKGFHILQLLRALENQIRKLLLVKCCTTELNITKTHNISRMNFNAFKVNILPKVIEYDEKTALSIKELNDSFLYHDAKKKKEQAKFFLAPNPKNAYPVFIIFQKSEKFSQNELKQALIFLSDIDYKMKSSSFDAKTALENFIIKLSKQL